MSIRGRITLGVVASYIILAFFSGLLLYFLAFKRYKETSETRDIVKSIKHLPEFISAYSVERRLSFIFVSTGEREKLDSARSATDEKSKKLPKEYSTVISKLQEIRKKVDGRSFSAIESYQAYTNLLEEAINITAEDLKNIEHSKLLALSKSAVLMLEFRDVFGRERLFMDHFYNKKTLNLDEILLLKAAIIDEENYTKKIERFGLEEAKKLKEISEDPQIKDLRKKALQGVAVEMGKEDWENFWANRIKKIDEVAVSIYDKLVKEVDKEFRTSIVVASLVSLISLGSFVFLGLLGFYMVKNISRALTSVYEGVKEVVQEGKLSVRLETVRNDELSQIASYFNNLLESLSAVIDNVKSVMSSASMGDFSKMIDLDLKGDLSVLKTKINAVIDVLAFLTESVKSVSNASIEVSKAMELVENGSRTQSESIQRIASAIEEISQAVAETSNSIELASESVNQTFRTVETASELMKNFKNSMAKVREEGEKVSLVVSAINNIAEQVNLLALNAAIEAARAGEQGRGFAVVSDEVRRLAEQAGKMAQSVSEIVKGVIASINEGYVQTETVYNSFEEIKSSTEKIRETLQMVAASMEETSAGMSEISNTVERLKEIGNSNASAAEEVLSSMIELSKKSKEVIDRLETLKS